MKTSMNFRIQSRSRLMIAVALLLISVACLEAVYPPHAILVKQGQPVKYDKIIKPVEGLYGAKDNLDGPGLENQYFAVFFPILSGKIYCDLIAKRQYIPVIEKFKTNTKRHAFHDWGTDVFSSGGDGGFGISSFAVVHDGQPVAPEWEAIDHIEITILSDQAEDSSIRLKFNGWKIAEESIDVEWTISTQWEARWVKHTLKFPKGFDKELHFGTTRHLEDYQEDEARAMIYGLGDQTYKNVTPRHLLTALKGDPEMFIDFFTEGKNIGLISKLDKEGRATFYTSASWAGEPSPLFQNENWPTMLFQGID